MKDNLKGLGWFGVALFTCPCHLALFIPLLAGTALGMYIMDHTAATVIIFGGMFVFSLFMGWRRLSDKGKQDSSMDCCIQKKNEVK